MGNYLFLLVQSGRSASATTCLLLLIPAVSCFFPRLLNMYHFVQNTLSDINADPDERHQSATIRPRWSLLCWCFFFFFFLSFMFWLRAFTLKVLKNWFFECYISCRLCGPVALALDSLFCCCAVCKPGAKLHQNTTDTKRTVHRMYMWRGNWAQMCSDCQEVPLLFFFWLFFLVSSSILLVNLQTQEGQKQELLTIWVWFQENAGYFCRGGILSTTVRAHCRHVP